MDENSVGRPIRECCLLHGLYHGLVSVQFVKCILVFTTYTYSARVPDNCAASTANPEKGLFLNLKTYIHTENLSPVISTRL